MLAGMSRRCGFCANALVVIGSSLLAMALMLAAGETVLRGRYGALPASIPRPSPTSC